MQVITCRKTRRGQVQLQCNPASLEVDKDGSIKVNFGRKVIPPITLDIRILGRTYSWAPGNPATVQEALKQNPDELLKIRNIGYLAVVNIALVAVKRRVISASEACDWLLSSRLKANREKFIELFINK